MSKELELIAESMRAVATEGAREDGQLWGAFPNTMTVHDLAEHVVSKLTDAGYSIIQLPEGENNWEVTNWDGGRVSLCYGGDTVRCYLPNPALEVVEAEELGIALIAASRYLAAARDAGGRDE